MLDPHEVHPSPFTNSLAGVCLRKQEHGSGMSKHSGKKYQKGGSSKFVAVPAKLPRPHPNPQLIILNALKGWVQ